MRDLSHATWVNSRGPNSHKSILARVN